MSGSDCIVIIIGNLQDGTITPPLAQTVLTTFDKCINKALSQRVKNKVNFKVRNKIAYRAVSLFSVQGKRGSFRLG